MILTFINVLYATKTFPICCYIGKIKRLMGNCTTSIPQILTVNSLLVRIVLLKVVLVPSPAVCDVFHSNLKLLVKC